MYHVGERPWRDAAGFWIGLASEDASFIDEETLERIGVPSDEADIA